MTNHPQQPVQSVRPRAFSLVEILIVIGIIALLAGILLPMIMRASRNAGRMRTQQDFQAISSALEAYKQHHGDYPRVEAANTGFAVLGKSLMGRFGDGYLPSPPAATNTDDTADPTPHQTGRPYLPGECSRAGNNFYLTLTDTPAGTAPAVGHYYTYFNPHDGHDGPGFKVRAGAVQVFGPYVDPGKVKNRGLAILDANERPILYFPARPGKPNLTRQATAGQQPYLDRPTAGERSTSLFNADDNLEQYRRVPDEATDDAVVVNRIRIMFGDLNHNGYIDNGETAINQPFVLISSGPDGVFGPAQFTPSNNAEENRRAVEKCDDVSNVQ